MMRRATLLLPLLLFTGFVRAQPYDIVIANGRVMDPATNLDAVRHIGIRAGKIAAISQTPLHGRATIEAKGLVVAPGFIDLHSHGQTPENYRFKARDGVTTALEMERGAAPVAEWYREREGKALVNFGATSGDIPARMAVMHDSGTLLPRDAGVKRATTPEERRQILYLLRRGLDEGAPGIGMGTAYFPLETRSEVLDVFQLAAQRKTPVYVHMRNGGPVEPGAIDALQEVIADAAATGASVHVVHITSIGLRETAQLLTMIEGAQARPGHHHRGVPLHRRHDRPGLRHLRRRLANAAGRNRVRRPALGLYRRAPHARILRALPQAGWHGGDPFHPGRHRAPGACQFPGDGCQRRHHGRRQGPSARRRHLCPRAGPLRSRTARPQPDGRAPQNDRHARRPPRHPHQGPHRHWRRRRPGGFRSGPRHRPRHL